MIDKDSAEHYVWGSNCDGWHLVKSASFSVIQELMPAQTTEVRHKHLKSRQFFFVLSGEATIELDGKQQTLHSHQGLEVAPNLPHQVSNNANGDLHFLVISCPPSHGDRVSVE